MDNKRPVVAVVMSFGCPHCGRSVQTMADNLDMEHLDANEEFVGETHLFLECPNCHNNVEVRRG